MIRRFLRWLNRNHVSTDTLNGYAYEATKTGWTDGPVWRTPAELDQMRRRERRAQLSVVRKQRAR